MTVGTGVMKLAVFTLALIISSDVPVADVSQAIGPVMATMTVETSVMKPRSIAPKKVSNFVNLWNLFLSCYIIFGICQSEYQFKMHCSSEKIYIRETVIFWSLYFHSFSGFSASYLLLLWYLLLWSLLSTFIKCFTFYNLTPLQLLNGQTPNPSQKEKKKTRKT